MTRFFCFILTVIPHWIERSFIKSYKINKHSFPLSLSRKKVAWCAGPREVFFFFKEYFVILQKHLFPLVFLFGLCGQKHTHTHMLVGQCDPLRVVSGALLLVLSTPSSPGPTGFHCTVYPRRPVMSRRPCLGCHWRWWGQSNDCKPSGSGHSHPLSSSGPHPVNAQRTGELWKLITSK